MVEPVETQSTKTEIENFVWDDATPLWRAMRGDGSGRLKTVGVDGLQISAGNISGMSVIHKFGHAPDFDTGDGEVTIWDGAEDDAAWENMVYDYSTTADIDSISSSKTADTVAIEVHGLDTNYNVVTTSATLNGVTRVALSTAYIRVYRAKNIGSANLSGHVAVYPNTALTAGIPTDKSAIRILIHPENNQTEMAIYTVPNGKSGYLDSFYASVGGANKSSNYIIKLFVRPFGGVFQLKHRTVVSDDGSSRFQYNFSSPEKILQKSDVHMTVETTAVGVTATSVAGGFDIILVDD